MTEYDDTLPTLDEMLDLKADDDGVGDFAWDFSDYLVQSEDVADSQTDADFTNHNGKILRRNDGTICVVLDGVGYAYTSPKHFKRVHWWSKTVTKRNCSTVGGIQICNTSRHGVGFKRYPLETIAPQIKLRIMDPLVALVKEPFTNGTIWLVHNGVRRAVGSHRAFDNYQFNWGKVIEWKLSEQAWNKITPVHRSKWLREETGAGR